MDGDAPLTAVIRDAGEAAALRRAGAAPPVIELRGALAGHLALVQAARTGDPWLASTVVAVRPGVPDEVAGVLAGRDPDDLATARRYAAERFVLRHADVLLTPGGDVAGALGRFYGRGSLAPAVTAPEQDAGPVPEPDDQLPWLDEDYALRLVCAGSDAAVLLDALALLPEANVELTVVSDQPLPVDDPRVMVRPPTEEPAALTDAHVAVVCPRWDLLPGLALRALARNRPVLATPVGALVALVEPDRSGWLAHGTSASDLATAVADVRADPDGYRRLAGGPQERRRSWAAATPDPLPAPLAVAATAFDVHAAVVHTGVLADLERTLDAVAAQTRPVGPVGPVVVVDAGLGDADTVEARRGVRLVRHGAPGTAGARNLGVATAGGDLVLVLDAGDVPEPAFVERALRAFARDPGLAYVTSWTDHEQPLGTEDGLVDRADVGGPPAALVRPGVFEHDARLDEDRPRRFHQRLWRLGLRGAVVPEVLLHTASRPRPDGTDDDALRAARRAAAVRWTAG